MSSAFIALEDVSKVEPRCFLEHSLFPKSKIPVWREQHRQVWASASVPACIQTCFFAGERQFLLYVQGEQSWLLPVTRTKEEERADS